MEILSYLFPYNDLILPLTLKKVNQHYFGKDEIKLNSGKDLFDYLVSPADSVFMRVESDSYESLNIYWGNVVIIERSNLRYDGPAALKINNEMLIREIKFSKDFETIIHDPSNLLGNESFEYFGTIAYVLKSEEEDFLDIFGQELFIIT